jgi:MoxR-like ATPase
MAKPETLPLINGVLDHRRSITNPFTGDVISAHPDFRVIAAINEGYIGTVPLNEALKNRFVTIDVPYLQGETLFQLLKSKSVLRDEKQLRTFVQLSADLLSLIEMGQLPDEAGSIRALLDACDLTAYIPPMRAVARAIADKLEDERERAAVMNAAETLF